MSSFPKDRLLTWYDAHQRDLPWRKIGDPYRIWVSEIMLQQTRVDTAIPYYERFLSSFPTVTDLADADQQEVLKCWEGLGYYSRARNLHQAAKTVRDQYDGELPGTYDELLTLKGIGPYTAAAISSIAFQEPKAVVDGNVLRVFARFFGIGEDIRSGKTKRTVQALADDALSKNRPGDFNQAVMELGATICTPDQPSCIKCPVSASCTAYHNGTVHKLPFKSKAKKVPHHTIGVGIPVDEEGKLLIAQRPEEAMLGGLWEFPGGKKEKRESLRDTVARELHEELDVVVDVLDKVLTVKHAYSHFKITLHAYLCSIQSGKPRPKSSQQLRWVTVDELDTYPFPKANKELVKALQQNRPEARRAENRPE